MKHASASRDGVLAPAGIARAGEGARAGVGGGEAWGRRNGVAGGDRWGQSRAGGAGRALGQPGFTLVLTLVIAAGLVLACVGVLTLARQDLAASRAQAHGLRAELAVAGGLAEAERVIAKALQQPGAVVALLDTESAGSPGLAAGDSGPQDAVIWTWEEDAWQPTPLGSGLEVEGAGAGEGALGVTAASPVWDQRQAKIPLWSRPGVQARAQWLEPETQGPRDAAKPGEVRVRFAWWAEDLAGLVNLQAVAQPAAAGGSAGGLGGGVGGSGAGPGTSGNSAQGAGSGQAAMPGGSLPLHGLFRPEESLDTEADQPEDQLVETRSAMGGSLGGVDVGLLFSEKSATQRQELQQRLQRFSWAGVEGWQRELVPRGPGFAQNAARTPKADLRKLVADRDVEGIADHIALHLPEFAERKGGFPDDQDYLKTLAANLIDYADPDSDATVGTDYRGVDAMPFVNELYLAYHWIKAGEVVPSGASAAANEILIETRTFVELWNPSNQPVSGEVKLRLDNGRSVQNLPGAFGTKVMRDLLIPQPGEVEYRPVQIELAPNGFAVVEMVAASNGKPPLYRHPVPAAFPLSQLYTSASQLSFPPEVSSQSRWTLLWNDEEVDRPRGGFEQAGGTLSANWGQRKWLGVNGTALDLSNGQFADPRASWYIQDIDPTDALGYIYAGTYATKTSWGGRTNRRNPNQPFDHGFPSVWPDGGPNSQPGLPATPDNLSSSNARMPNRELVAGWKNWPENVDQFPPNEPLKAPVHIANYPDGVLRRVTDWGQVFDPAQWKAVDGRGYAGSGPAHTADGQPKPADWEARPKPEPAAGGGATLAIGRPEFAAFRDEIRPWRATRLLDLFTVHPDAWVRPDGQVNVNTAPKEVLQMLFSGVLLDLDPNWPPVEVATLSSGFAEAILQWRSGQGSEELGLTPGPLRSPADLAAIATEPEAGAVTGVEQNPGARAAWFGNPQRLGMPSAAEFTWTDAAREQLFAEVFERVRTDSRALRLHAVAEVYQVLPGGKEKLLARRARLREVSFSERDGQGQPRWKARVVAERPL